MSTSPVALPTRPDRTPRGQSPRVGSPRRQRDASRAFHLGASLALLVFVYGPAELTAELQPWMRVVVVPLLGLTGLFLWKQAQIRRFLATVRRGVSRPAANA